MEEAGVGLSRAIAERLGNIPMLVRCLARVETPSSSFPPDLVTSVWL